VRSERSERRRSRALAAAGLVAGLVLAVPALASGDNIVLEPDMGKLLALIALFVLLIFPVNSLLFKPIHAALDARDEKIAGTRARAEKLAAEADEILARYEGQVRGAREEAELERRETLNQARAASLSEATAARAAAERDLDGARGEIAAELERARTGLRREAEQLARAAAGRVLGRPLS
jgi:F-type H+-transporting ATPase subunit b